MSCVLAVSPHLDDAIFSAGGTLAQRARQGWRVIVVTCFTANVAQPAGFALACQLDKGLGPEVDYMALRRAEDITACVAIGAEPLHLPFFEAPHRGYDSAPALFAEVRGDDYIEILLSAQLDRLIDDYRPELILGPLAIGNHVDHHIVRSALTAAGRFAAKTRTARLLLWEDWPYADHAPVPDSNGEVVQLDEADVAAKIAGALAYSSQLGFQFGSAAALTGRLQARRSEAFHTLA